jgi:predicted RecB family nuclease
MAEIPPDFPLTKAQARIREAHRSGDAFVSPGLGDALRPLGPPTLHLDFEVLSAGEPLYAGTRPYQPIPFQWSLHAVDGSGASTHRAFLADGRDDPRREFAESLLEATGATDAPILVWSNYEAGVLRRLSDALPSLRPELLALASRLVDLLALVREHLYQPAFGGSYSIKDVAPALAPGFGWGDLAESTGIADGAAAAAAFESLARDPLAGETEERIRAALRAYCARDTEAMVRVHAALRQLAESPGPAA